MAMASEVVPCVAACAIIAGSGESAATKSASPSRQKRLPWLCG